MGVKWYGAKVISKINKANKQIINKACLMVERDAKILCLLHMKSKVRLAGLAVMLNMRG